MRTNVFVAALLILQWCSDQVDCQGGVPSMPSNLAVSTVTATSVALTWTQPSQENVSTFVINYRYEVIGCPGVAGFTDVRVASSESAVGNGGDAHMFNLTDLEENSIHVFNVLAENSGQSSAATMDITVDTMLAASTAPPVGVAITVTTPTTVIVTWQRVSCIDRNAEITNYAVRYGETGSGVFKGDSVPDFPRERMITGLIPWTNYTIGVSTQHVDLSASPPLFLSGSEGTVTAITSPPPDLGFFHDGVLLPNNSVISSIGNCGLFCLTTSASCCEDDGSNDWFLPGSSDPVDRATSNDQVIRRVGAVVLNKTTSFSTPPTGVYTCRIPDSNGNMQTLYAGVGLGPSIVISDLSFSDPTNTTSLVCTSTGRPVNMVTWFKNGQVIDFGANSAFTTSQSLTDPVRPVYLNVLSSQDTSNFIGTFTCQLTDAEEPPVPVVRTFIVNDVTVTNDEFIVGSRAVANCTSSVSNVESITWTNPAGDVLAFTNSSNRLELVFNPVSDDQVQGEEITCSVRGGAEVASQSFRVSLIAPSNPLGATTNTSDSPVAGSRFKVTCLVTELVRGLSNQPTAIWLNNDGEPVSNSHGVSTSMNSSNSSATAVLMFQSLLTSQGFQYSCVGGLRLAFSGADVSVEETYIVEVSLPPPSVEISSTGPYNLGEGTTLTCTAVASVKIDSGTVVGRFRWYSSERELVPGNDPNFEITQPTNSRVTGRLVIVSLGVNDTNFTCSASIHLETNPSRVSSDSSDFFVVTSELNVTSVEILASPTNSNLFAGLQFNLTCLVNITAVQGTTPVVAVTWMRNGTLLESGSRITVQGLATQTSQSGDLIDRYEGVVVFESLEIDDIGMYSCFANLTLSAGDFVGSASGEAQQQIYIERQCVQLRIDVNCEAMGVNTCTVPTFFDYFVNAINSECGNCGFSERSVTDVGCTCFLNQLTIHAKIQGTLERNASDLVDVIESWVQSGVMVPYMNQNSTLSTDAAVSIPSAHGMCVPTPPVTTMQDGETDSSGTDTMMTTGGAHITRSLCYTWILTLILAAATVY